VTKRQRIRLEPRMAISKDRGASTDPLEVSPGSDEPSEGMSYRHPVAEYTTTVSRRAAVVLDTSLS